jgi:hypothetical protein
MSPPSAPALEPAPTVPDPSSDDELLLRDSDSELEYADLVKSGVEAVYCSQSEQDDYLTLDEALEYALKTATHFGEPNSLREAMQKSPEERASWYKAAVDEIQSLVDNGTFELVQLPPGRKAIGSRWVF